MKANRDRNHNQRDKDKFDRKERAQHKLQRQQRMEEEFERDWSNQMRELQMGGHYR